MAITTANITLNPFDVTPPGRAVPGFISITDVGGSSTTIEHVELRGQSDGGTLAPGVVFSDLPLGPNSPYRTVEPDAELRIPFSVVFPGPTATTLTGTGPGATAKTYQVTANIRTADGQAIATDGGEGNWSVNVTPPTPAGG